MSASHGNLTLMGVPLTPKAGANTERILQAIRLVESRFAEQTQNNRGRHSKEVLLTFMALELADELLSLQRQRTDTQQRLERLLEQVEHADTVQSN